MRTVVIITVAAIGVSCACLGYSQTATVSEKSAVDLAANVLSARVEALRKNDFDPNSQEVEKRLAALYRNSSKEADEAIVILMNFYLGEHEGEELYENLLSRGPRMIPILERYAKSLLPC
jgi:hypothetical protein